MKNYRTIFDSKLSGYELASSFMAGHRDSGVAAPYSVRRMIVGHRNYLQYVEYGTQINMKSSAIGKHSNVSIVFQIIHNSSLYLVGINLYRLLQV